MKKSISRSIRVTPEVNEYILAFDGDGFNQKLENLVLFFLKKEDVKRKLLNDLDSEIREKRDLIHHLDDVSISAKQLIKLIDQFNFSLESTLDDVF